MAEVGVRELKQRASEILRHVREDKETYSVTYRGKVVARLVPAEDRGTQTAEAKTVLDEMDELASRISAHWPAESTAADAVREQRRAL